jgi:hypothetical protein
MAGTILSKGDFIGMIIYSASPLSAFMTTLLTVGGLMVIGVVGLVYGLTTHRKGKKGWVGIFIASLFLCLMGVLVLGVTIVNMSASTQTVTAALNKKTVAEDNCNDGETCTRYILEMASASKSYDFTVVKQAFDAAQEGLCYQVIYYPNKGLFATNNDTSAYVATSYITRITQVDQSTCIP